MKNLARLIFAGATLAALAVSAAAEDHAGEELFVRRVLPVFEERCVACHGKDEAKIKSGFDLRSLASVLKGGESGEPGLVPGAPEKSALFLSIERTHDEWKAMPPKENDRLSPEQVGWIKEWIRAGAPWPDAKRIAEIGAANAEKWSAADGMTVPTEGALSPIWANRRYQTEALWAYRPVRKPAVPAGGANPIDALLAAGLPAGVHPAGRADRRTLLRRASFDLLGLPPTPEEIANFMNDPAADREAFARVTERLLASPHYGEQWGRHWLDVVRYADSSGFSNDYERGNAWRYRDYVVRAFNDDKPYDRFVQEQIAGDELDGSPESLIATGFLRMGPWELTSMEVAKIARQRFLDDVTNAVGETFLAHSLQCARCHDHKFDPVPTHDYYAMQACFGTTQLTERPAAFLPAENQAGFDERAFLEARRAEYRETLRKLDEKQLATAEKWYEEHGLDATGWHKTVASMQKFVRENPEKANATGSFEFSRNRLMKLGVKEDQIPPRYAGFSTMDYGLDRMARKGLERLKWELDRYEPIAFSVYDGATPEVKFVVAPVRMPENPMSEGKMEETAILAGGDPFSPIRAVTPAPLSALDFFNPGLVPLAGFPAAPEGRRLALARWIASKENPLTTRCIVNRLWLWHFGQAIAGNPNNFGSTGKRPSQPALLDWLAATFVEQGWSIKAMHRLIMSSDAYARSAEPDPANAASAGRDELESAYAVFKPRRLAAEELRDAMLSITGELNPALGGIPNRPEINREAALQPRQVMGTFAHAWAPNPLPAQRNRRSLYALHLRGLRDPFLEVFNEPAPDFSCEGRVVSTVTPQVFSLFNSQASYARALALAARVTRECVTPEGSLRRLFALTCEREPGAEELQVCLRHWEKIERMAAPPVPVERPPLTVKRQATEENTGDKFAFEEPMEGADVFVPDLDAATLDAHTRALADVCLVLLNSNEFCYVY
jgi:mono/diheme cytochrome c family protein